jgi:hypothetical protein
LAIKIATASMMPDIWQINQTTNYSPNLKHIHAMGGCLSYDSSGCILWEDRDQAMAGTILTATIEFSIYQNLDWIDKNILHESEPMPQTIVALGWLYHTVEDSWMWQHNYWDSAPYTPYQNVHPLYDKIAMIPAPYRMMPALRRVRSEGQAALAPKFPAEYNYTYQMWVPEKPFPYSLFPW